MACQPQQYNTNVAELLPVDEFTEILIGGKQNCLGSIRSREDAGITCLPICFRYVLDVVTVGPQCLNNGAVDILVRQYFHFPAVEMG